ncbi:MAG: hypothetical protein AAFP08_16060, partial [Bacteroidota bacterium]
MKPHNLLVMNELDMYIDNENPIVEQGVGGATQSLEHGLYVPQLESDACGTGLIAQLDGSKRDR